MLGGALLNSVFLTNTATGGNGGDGGSGLYGGGNGGDGGGAFGGCLYNAGQVVMVNNQFATCVTIPGTNGAAGSGPFPGLPGRIKQAITNAINNSITNRFTNAFGAFGTSSPMLPPPPVAGPLPASTDPGTAQYPADTSVGAAENAGLTDAQAQTLLASAAPTPKPTSPPTPATAGGVGAAGSNSAAGATGPPATLPSNRADRSTGTPTPAGTNPAVPANVPPAKPAPQSPGDEPLPEGMIDFRGADLNQVLDIYGMLVNRTLLRPAVLPAPTIILKTQGHLTVNEGVQALQAVLALNGITMVDVGEKFVKVIPEAQSGSAAAPFNTNSAAQLPDLGQYVTHVVQLKYAKPSDLVPVLTPFEKIPNGILPLDPNMILVIRDYAENVKRMLEMVNQIDVAVPSEFIQEVIPIKYAQATDIASALNSLSAGGGGGAVTVGGTGSTSAIAEPAAP